jgi:hypothetical protein
VGNAGVVAAWALSRTAGLPAGPDAWTAEPVTPLDGAATAFELAVVAASTVLLRARAAERLPREARRFAAVGATAVAGLTAAVLAFAGGGHYHHGSHHDEAAPAAARHLHPGVAPEQTVVRPRAERVRAAEGGRNASPAAAANASHDHSAHAHEHP